MGRWSGYRSRPAITLPVQRPAVRMRRDRVDRAERIAEEVIGELLAGLEELRS